MTVGANVTVGQSRLDVLGENAGIIRSVMGELDRVAPDAAVVITGDPVDVLTRIAIECSARREQLIMGTGRSWTRRACATSWRRPCVWNPRTPTCMFWASMGKASSSRGRRLRLCDPLAAFPVPVGTTLVEIRGQCEATTRRRERTSMPARLHELRRGSGSQPTCVEHPAR